MIRPPIMWVTGYVAGDGYVTHAIREDTPEAAWDRFCRIYPEKACLYTSARSSQTSKKVWTDFKAITGGAQ